MVYLFLIGLVVAVPVAILVILLQQRAGLRRMDDRVGRIEAQLAREHPPLAAVPPAREPAPLQAPIPIARATPPVPPAPAAAADAAPAAGASGGLVPPWPPAHVTGAPPTPRPRLDSAGIEQLIGSVWLQNVGSVLLLLGVFFMILWGYSTGRLGPGVLVAAGVALGLAFVWRGDRIARSVPAFGHALIGIGLGVVYLALYLGHSALHVLSPWSAFALLALVSFASIAVGMRYRVQTIATLGVIGAFVPQLMAAWLSMRGLILPAPGLLAYLGVVDSLVFVLAARAGWSGLNLAALMLSAATWIWAYHAPGWGWGTQIGLSALFTLLGIAPLPRLVGLEGRVRPIDLLVIALAPLCVIAASRPMLALEARAPVAMLLIVLAIVQLAAALWVDSRRPERDLWRPLTGAAVLFLTAALERAAGTEHTPMAWCVEGVVLVALGLRARGGWLRLCGSAVSLLGVLWLLGSFAMPTWRNDQLPVFHPEGLRDLVCLATVLAGAYLLARGRRHLAPGEGLTPEVWTAAGNLLLMLWSGREAYHLAFALQGSGGRWQLLPPVGIAVDTRLWALVTALWSAAWMAHAFVLALLGGRAGRGFLRLAAGALGVAATITLLVAHAMNDGWWLDRPPGLHPTALLGLLTVALAAAASLHLARRRGILTPQERWSPELWSLAASIPLLFWAARESGHAARVLIGHPGMPGSTLPPAVLMGLHTLEAAITSGAWLIEAIVLLAAGWLRGSAFLRWCGLALFGLTVGKFLLVDLQNVDVFWRFLTAIVVGAAMLAMSYAYQARTRGPR